MNSEEKLRALLKENKTLKQKLKSKEVDKMTKKEAVDIDKDVEQKPTESPKSSASIKPDGATQDDMGTKYEEQADAEEEEEKESVDMDKDEQSSPSESPKDSAVAKPAEASQDDMGVKYEEAEGDEQKPVDAAVEEGAEVEENGEEEIKESGDEVSDTDKIVEILEALKAQVDENTKKLQEMSGPEEEKPEAPMSEKLRRLTESISNDKPVNYLKML